LALPARLLDVPAGRPWSCSRHRLAGDRDPHLSMHTAGSATSESRGLRAPLGSWLTNSGGIGSDATRGVARVRLSRPASPLHTANVYGAAPRSARGARSSPLSPRLLRYRDQAVLPMSAKIAGFAEQVHKHIDAREAPGHGLRRLYQCHPLRHHDARCRDHASADRGRGGRQGAWIRLQRAGPSGSPSLALSRRGEVLSSRRSTRAVAARPAAEVIPLCARNGSLRSCVRLLAQGRLPGQVPPRRGRCRPGSLAASRAEAASFGQWLNRPTLDAVDRLCRSPRGRRRMAQLALPGCCAQTTSRAPSSALAPTRWHENAPRRRGEAERPTH